MKIYIDNLVSQCIAKGGTSSERAIIHYTGRRFSCISEDKIRSTGTLFTLGFGLFVKKFGTGLRGIKQSHYKAKFAESPHYIKASP